VGTRHWKIYCQVSLANLSCVVVVVAVVVTVAVVVVVVLDDKEFMMC
jgi:hypothetical protein